MRRRAERAPIVRAKRVGAEEAPQRIGRYRTAVFERFTDQARQMMLTAQEEGRLLQHDYVGTEHLLIAATEVDGGLPSALATLGLTTEALRSSVTRMMAMA